MSNQTWNAIFFTAGALAGSAIIFLLISIGMTGGFEFTASNGITVWCVPIPK